MNLSLLISIMRTAHWLWWA